MHGLTLGATLGERNQQFSLNLQQVVTAPLKKHLINFVLALQGLGPSFSGSSQHFTCLHLTGIYSMFGGGQCLGNRRDLMP